jgi:hypothetical protein
MGSPPPGDDVLAALLHAAVNPAIATSNPFAKDPTLVVLIITANYAFGLRDLSTDVVEPTAGVEPATYGLRNRRSTN